MKRREILRAGGAALAASVAMSRWTAASRGDTSGRLPPELAAWMGVAPVPGAWVAVFERHAIAAARGFGVRDVATGAPVDDRTIFEAASLTKQVTAYVAHSLHATGHLDFDRPLNAYIGRSADPAAAAVTARHVLGHSSGFPNWRSRVEDALAPAFPPGTKYQYSGEGYVYLSRAIEAIADAPFGRIVRDRVFVPLGMRDSSLSPPSASEGRLARGHDRRGNLHDAAHLRRFWEAESRNGGSADAWRYADLERILRDAQQPVLPNAMTPNAAASLRTTGPDFATFVLHAARQPAYREWLTTIREGAGWRLGFGPGWGLERVAEREFLWQWGDNRGYKNFVAFEPARGRGVLVFTNGDSGFRICDRVVSHVTGTEHPAFFWLS